ncbi:MAG: biopolymer transporter ExbD [Planctomycetes bacterium]|nr:biopolymer transporter ExbD [Planctomycetota bacterium]
MKIRGTGKIPDKVEMQMAPMIDVVFQLLIFFMLTFKIIAPEGDFNINMPIGTPTQEEQTILPDIKVHLVAGPGGSLERVMLGRRNLGSDVQAFRRLNNEILKIIGKPGNPLNKDIEVEIKADFSLHYNYTVQAIAACTGRLDSKGQMIRYIEKIKFAPPQRPGS